MTYLEKKKMAFMANVKKSRLPAGYTEVNYIEATGTQYTILGQTTIDSYDTKLEYTAQFTGIDYDLRRIYAFGSVGAKTNFTVWESYNSYQFSTLGQGNTVSSATVQQKHTVTFLRTSATTAEAYVNDNLITSISGTMASNTGANLIFGSNSSTIRYIGKLWNLTRWQNGIVVLDLVPCLNPNNTAGVYDLVSQQFFGSDTDPYLYG